jgi:oligoribonuclease
MLLIFLDSEMTGLNPEKHRLLEIAYVVMDSITGRHLLTYEAIISQPSEVWAEANPESLKINGFTWEKTLSGKSERAVAAEIANDLNHLQLDKRGGVFICQNPSMDRLFFCQLLSVDLQGEYGWPYHWLDLASMFWAVRLMENKKSASEIKEEGLSKNKIARFYGLPPEKSPHSALGGVDHLIACYEAMFGKIGVGL